MEKRIPEVRSVCAAVVVVAMVQRKMPAAMNLYLLGNREADKERYGGDVCAPIFPFYERPRPTNISNEFASSARDLPIEKLSITRSTPLFTSPLYARLAELRDNVIAIDVLCGSTPV